MWLKLTNNLLNGYIISNYNCFLWFFVRFLLINVLNHHNGWDLYMSNVWFCKMGNWHGIFSIDKISHKKMLSLSLVILTRCTRWFILKTKSPVAIALERQILNLECPSMPVLSLCHFKYWLKRFISSILSTVIGISDGITVYTFIGHEHLFIRSQIFN